MNTDYGNFELIIVDDSSEPQTNALLIEEQNKYPNLLFIRLPRNLGSTKARKIGLDASKGQFVFFHDDDDTVLQNRIFKPLDHLILHPYLDVVYCNYNVVDNDLNITPVYCQPFNEKAYLNLEFNIGAGILLGRRSTFVEVPFYSLYDNAVDYDWVFRLIRAGYKIDLCPEIVMNYNRSGATSQHLSGNVASIGKHKEIYEREVLLQKIKRS